MRTVGTVSASLLATCAMACMATLVGCSSGASGGGASEGAAPIPTEAQAQDDLLKKAELALVQRCLAKRGLALDEGLAASGQESSGGGSGGGGGGAAGNAVGQDRFPYGINDPSWAARNGFGMRARQASAPPASAESDSRTEPSSRTDRSESRERDRSRTSAATFGSGERELSVRLPSGYTVQANSDGCLATAQRQLYGNQERWFRAQVVVNNEGSETDRRVRRDSAYRSALDRWAVCMAPEQKAKDPAELRQIWERRASRMTDTESERLERRLAVAEARCVRSTGLARTGQRLDHEYAAEVRTENASERSDYQRMRERALHLAVQPSAPPGA
ncbi:hypothetical protein [Streptomyces sp. 8N616]|uniref:hypothetical protein n=1 Tax=Streptomyces sp. 8N616 TaxID=3457414 RepID=UPI003FD363C8